MVTEFRFPDVGEGITEGEIVEWLVKEGDAVKQDQIIVKVETDKAVVELPSPTKGTVLKIHHREGDTVRVGEVLVTIGEKSESARQIEKTESVVGVLEEARETEKEPIQPTANLIATPATRRLAKDLGVDLSTIKGTGKDGRITEDDVRAAAKHEIQPAVKVSKKYDLYGHISRVPLKGIRKSIARNLTKSYLTAVHVTTTDEADATDLVRLREKEKKKAEKKGTHLTYLPFIIKAVIAALKEHPYMNATLDDEHEEIILKEYYNIGIAVDTPDGLVVPVIKGADEKSILDIAKEIEELAEKAKERKLDLGDMKGGTFTITNIGVLGGIYATPIINYPEAAILLTGAIKEKPVVKDGKIQIRYILPLSLTFDHRITDGAEAARFVNKIKEYLEDPDELLVEGR